MSKVIEKSDQVWVANARSEGQRLWALLGRLKRYAVTGLPLSVLLTAIFYLQGRAFRYAYLERLGLDESLLPIPTAEVFWLSLHGWTSSAVLIVQGMWSAYCKMFAEYAVPVWLVTVVGFILLWLSPWIRKFFLGRWEKYSGFFRWRELARPRVRLRRWIKRSWARLRGLTVGLAATTFVVLASVSVAPLILFVLAFAIFFIFFVVVFPFFQTGEAAADDLCKRDRATISTVIFENGSAASRSSSYLIECREKYCALVDEAGSRFFIPTEDVIRVDAPQAHRKGKVDAPLCTLPENKKSNPRPK